MRQSIKEELLNLSSKDFSKEKFSDIIHKLLLEVLLSTNPKEWIEASNEFVQVAVPPALIEFLKIMGKEDYQEGLNAFIQDMVFLGVKTTISKELSKENLVQ